MIALFAFDENDCREVQRLKEYAEKYRIDEHILSAMSEGLVKPAGSDPNYTCKIRHLTIAFSIEEQPLPTGWVRHLSISQVNGELVDRGTTSIVMSYFDFKVLNPLKSYFHLDEKSNPKTVHVLEPLETTWDELLKNTKENFDETF